MERDQNRNTTAEDAIRLENGEAHPLRENQVHSGKYFELLKIRRQLPVSSKRQEFLDVYHRNQVSIFFLRFRNFNTNPQRSSSCRARQGLVKLRRYLSSSCLMNLHPRA